MKLKKDLLFIVIIPLILLGCYYSFFAANRYVSETILTVKNNTSTSNTTMSILGFQNSSKEDVLYLKAFIHSQDMYEKLNETIKLNELYSKEKKDFLYRIYSWMPKEWLLYYYQQRTQLLYDDITGLLTIKVEAFTQEDALLISKMIMEICDNFINDIEQNIYKNQLEYLDKELKYLQNNYIEQKEKLILFQNKYNVIDPISQIQNQIKIVSELEGTLSKKETELITILSYIQPQAPNVVTLEAEIKALKEQLNKEKKNSISFDEKTINIIFSEFNKLNLELSFAENVYKTALTGYEKLRVESNNKLKYLVVIQTPVIPEMALKPNKLYNGLTIFIILFLLLGVFRIIKSTIEDYKR